MEGALRRIRQRPRLADAQRDEGDREREAHHAFGRRARLAAHEPAVTSVTFGARSIEQLDDNLKAADVKLSAEDVQNLDDASAFDLGDPYKFMANVQKRW